ncbi:helix-turn-helix domain-containing protein [Anaerotalea alkaliphila]|uniref:AraC family transcriptional regulator n=1 Tax=Anaerotalea alkaliphila TaxID=2662126 RepID=A0A7X5HUE1_9FIRM|nr:AraC family transcriptional regulator [Anaerotalea alkaliphila]NDL66810.1 AraC family transcriptional regulator [Anaerotalea alkaliphila]
MIQCFNNHRFTSRFEGDAPPRLLYSCRTEERHRGMPRVMHMHEDRAELVFITSGTGIHHIGGRQFETKKGDLLLYDAGVVHDETANPNESLNVYGIAVSGLRLPGRPLNHFTFENTTPVVAVGDRFEEFDQLLGMIHSHTVSDNRGDAEFANYLLRAAIVLIDDLLHIQAAAMQTEQKVMVERIQAFLDKHYMEEVTLAQIAEHLNINQYYMSHLFKEAMGFSPMQYVIRRRIGEAQNLLINTDASVTNIAVTVGYNNSNHFHAAFQKMVGMTPAKYRKYWTDINAE